jgi:hypothetical protein
MKKIIVVLTNIFMQAGLPAPHPIHTKLFKLCIDEPFRNRARGKKFFAEMG